MTVLVILLTCDVSVHLQAEEGLVEISRSLSYYFARTYGVILPVFFMFKASALGIKSWVFSLAHASSTFLGSVSKA